MFPTIFNPREIHKLTQVNSMFRIVACHYNTLSQSEEEVYQTKTVVV